MPVLAGAPWPAKRFQAVRDPMAPNDV